MEIVLKEGDWAEIDYEWRLVDGHWKVPTKALRVWGKITIEGEVEEIALKRRI